MNKALFPGSFDPLTLGHMDTLKKAAPLFEKIYLAIAVNPNKKGLFTIEERKDLLSQAVAEQANVEVISFSEELTVTTAQELGVKFLIRGLRNTQDFEFEMNIAQMNKALVPHIQTLFLPCEPHLSFVSSSLVKEVYQFGGDYRDFVPANVYQAMEEKK